MWKPQISYYEAECDVNNKIPGYEGICKTIEKH
jgi:hypothetical protein